MTKGRGLTGRRADILRAIVEEYVRTVSPVGSKVVRERHGVAASSATIRHEMGVLERDGYVRQPHTSAGRVPADKGYRAYVDEIMPRRGPRAETVAWVRGEFRRAGRDPEELYRTTSRVLSQLANSPAMVMAPAPEEFTILDLRLTPVSSRVILLACRMRPGGDFECLVESPEPLTMDQVESLGRALAGRVCGRGVGALSVCVAEALEDDVAPHSVPRALLEEVKTAVENACAQRIYVDGAAYALDCPEYAQSVQLRPVMKALDEERVVRRLLRPAARRGRLTVTIGAEHEMRTLRETTLVARHYGARHGDIGALGIIGPTRMDYQSIIAAVRCVADQIAEAFHEDKPDDEDQQ